MIVVALAGCDSCRYRGGVELPREGTESPVRVPMNLTWESTLEIPSGGTYGPIPAEDVRAAADPSVCEVTIVPEVRDGDDERIVVVGLRTGRCDVALDYLNSHRKERMKAALHIDFVPAETLPALAMGAPLPAGPTSFGAADPARCEIDGAHFHCFALERFGREKRHASCKTSARCASSRGGPRGFELCAAIASGKVTGITSWVALPRDEVPIEGTWGDGGCVPK